MDTNIRFDHQFLAVESENAVHCMLELVVPDAATAARPPIHIALVMDRSGSMAGAKLQVAKQCASFLARRLGPKDELALVTYDEEVELVRPLAPVDVATVTAIETIHPGGATNLSGGWLKGLEELRRANDGVRRVVLLTDGLANAGIIDRPKLVALAEGTKAQAATTTIGFGDGFDEDLLTAMADASGGATYFAENPDDAPGIFAEEFEGLASIVAQNVSIEICPSDKVELVGVLNEYPMVGVGSGVQVQLGDAYGGERRRVVFELRIPQLAQLGPASIANVVLRYVTIGDPVAAHETTIPVTINLVSADEAAVAELDHEVIDEVVVLQAARAKKEAMRLADQGRYDDARKTLETASEDLRRLAPMSSRAEDLLEEAKRIDAHTFMMSEPDYSATTRKRMSSESWRSHRGRKP